MKYLLIFVFVALIINGIIFNLFVFANITYDIAYWSEDARACCAFAMFVGFGVSGVAAAIETGKIKP